MIKDERQYKILDYLENHKFANVKELARLLKCSEITIRRDINELSEKKHLVKIHGGAQALNEKPEKVDVSISHRTIQNTDAKQIITSLALTFIKPGQIIYLDAGSNVNLIIPFLKNLNVKVYTHGVHHISELSKNKIDAHLIGGEMKWSTLAAIGPLCIEEISQFHYDIAFLGTNAVDINFGLSTPDDNEAAIKQQIIKSSDQSFVLCDDSKFNKKSKIRFSKLEDVTIITNKKPSSLYDNLQILYPQK